MAITVSEKLESRKLTTGENASLELVLNVLGTDSDRDARIAAENAAPEAWGSLASPPLLFRQYIQLEVVSSGIWTATVRYAPTQPSRSKPAEDTFELDTSNGTQHITQSLATINRYGRPGQTAPDFKGAIGVSSNGVEGVDIVVPSYDWTETHKYAEISPTYKDTLSRTRGKFNSTPFAGFAAGEVLFLGGQASRRARDDELPWEITYKFSAQRNRSGFMIGDIGPIDKLGWDYMWVLYEDIADADALRLVKRPAAVYIERVYDPIDFAILGIGN